MTCGMLGIAKASNTLMRSPPGAAAAADEDNDGAPEDSATPPTAPPALAEAAPSGGATNPLASLEPEVPLCAGEPSDVKGGEGCRF